MLSEVRAYWEGLREGGALPRRDQIDPRGIAGALEQVFLVERIAPGLARFRLAGMGISGLMGMDVRGMPLSAVFDPAARDRLAPELETVFRDNVALDLWLEAERGTGRPALAARMVLLPLVSTRGLTDLALGCLAFEGEVGRAPRRFAISSLLSETLLVARKSMPEPTPRATGPRAAEDGATGFGAAGPRAPSPAAKGPGIHAPGFAEPQAGFTGAQTEFTPLRPPRGKPQLRLVKSGD